jgi:hypothetical protein
MQLLLNKCTDMVRAVKRVKSTKGEYFTEEDLVYAADGTLLVNGIQYAVMVPVAPRM